MANYRIIIIRCNTLIFNETDMRQNINREGWIFMKKVSSRIISLVLCMLMILPSMCGVSFAAVEYPTLVVDKESEMERGLLNSKHAQITLSKDASRGKAIQLLTNNTANPAIEEHAIAFKILLEETAEYFLELRGYVTGSANDSVLVSFTDNETPSYTALTMLSKNRGIYGWTSLSLGVLDGGKTYYLKLIGNEANGIFDAVKISKKSEALPEDISVYAPKYVPQTLTGEVKYPKILADDAYDYVPKFEDGDKVAFIGDSITYASSGGWYAKFLFNYYSTRYPNVDFSYVNKGIGGDRVSSLIDRIDHDIFDADYEKPFNKVVLMIGTNDMNRAEYYIGKDEEFGIHEKRNALKTTYQNSYQNFIDMLKERGIEEIIALSSPMFDEWLWYEKTYTGLPEYTTNQTSPGFNNVIRTAGYLVYNILNEKNDENFHSEFVDINTPMLIVELYNRFEKDGKENPYFKFSSDRIHPVEHVHWILTYSILKAQGESGEVATVSIDIPKKEAQTSRATVKDLVVAKDSVKYTYKADGLPLAADEQYRKAEELFPITDELNREIIKVTGLAKGNYEIKMDGKSVMVATAQQLAEGVNIADKENNPGQQQSLILAGLSNERYNKDISHRAFIRDVETSAISSYKLDATNNATLIASAEKWIVDNATRKDGVKALKKYLPYKKYEKTIVEAITTFEDEVYKHNKPTEHVVLITRTGANPTPVLEPVFFDYELPENLIPIKILEKDKAPVVEINGVPLKSDVAPVLVNGRTLVPMRAIFEALGATISYDEINVTATAEVRENGQKRTVTIKNNDNIAIVNGKETKLDVPAKIYDGRFLVPIRFVSENLGASVRWDSWIKLVEIKK